MLIVPIPKIAKNFAVYLEYVTANKGIVVVISDEDKPIAVIEGVTDEKLKTLLSLQRSESNGELPRVDNNAEYESLDPAEEKILGDDVLIEYYLTHIKPHLEKFGRVYTTDTPDIRLAIPGRKKSSVIAYVRKRKNYLKLYFRRGSDNDFPTLDLRPSEGVPRGLDALLAEARKMTERM